jgi:predicted LPLAT superfamily acyltransferase
MRADRTLAGKGIPVMLLGRPVELPAGPFLAAALSGAPVVSVYNCRLGHRRYACRVSPLRRYGEDQPGSRDDRLKRAAEDYAQTLESMLREFPCQWSNFFDYWQVQAPQKEPAP